MGHSVRLHQGLLYKESEVLTPLEDEIGFANYRELFKGANQVPKVLVKKAGLSHL